MKTVNQTLTRKTAFTFKKNANTSNNFSGTEAGGTTTSTGTTAKTTTLFC